MKDDSPAVSIIMSVLNCERTLDESLQCLIEQSERDWECIVCNDGSSDGTEKIIQRWKQRFPDKFVCIRNYENLGLSKSLNRCIALARGKYIARMDGDDLCSHDRLEKEIDYLKRHPSKSIVSVDMRCFDEDGVWGLRAYPTEPEPVDLVHGTPFCHAGCMVIKDAIQAVDGYSEEDCYDRVEDYDLWVRMYAAGYRGANIHEPLYQMRDDRNATTRRKWKARVNEARVRLKAVRMLYLPFWKSVYALRPLILGLLPGSAVHFLHRQKLKQVQR